MKTPENGWLEDDPFLLGPLAYFRGRAVSFGEVIKGRKLVLVRVCSFWGFDQQEIIFSLIGY